MNTGNWNSKFIRVFETIIKKVCSCIITTDKVYKNREWIYGYREIDELEQGPLVQARLLWNATNSWISSFCSDKTIKPIN